MQMPTTNAMLRLMPALSLLAILMSTAPGLDAHWSVAPITIKIGHQRRTPIRFDPVSVEGMFSGALWG